MSKEKSVWDFVKTHPEIRTPYYLIDEAALLKNMEKIKYVRERSGAKSVLALKCFSTPAVFPLMSEYMDGTTSSALYEARLGHEKFGKETQAYSVAWSPADIDELATYASKIIFNSVSQLKRLSAGAKGVPLGLRINPGISYSHYDLANPARKNCRLGVGDIHEIEIVKDMVSGFMFHVNCENDDLDAFSRIVDQIVEAYGSLLKDMQWVSLGGGITFTDEKYPIDAFCARLKKFSDDFNVQVYLEPGYAAVKMGAYLVTQVQDLVHNETDIAIINAAMEAHMLDLLVYRETPTVALPTGTGGTGHRYTIAGNTCLAGDEWGTHDFPTPLQIGDYVIVNDAAPYTMVKMNWFNGVQMPSIVVKRLDGTVDVIRKFTYDDFKGMLS